MFKNTKGQPMSMKQFVAAATLALATVHAAWAGEFATAQEAQAMVAKTVTAIKANKQKTFDEITAKNPKWIDRDLYIFVLDLNGVALAHGANAKLVGKELGELKDTDGKSFVKEMLDQARSTGKCTVDYRWTDPISKKILSKRSFCERLDDAIVGAGIYVR